MSNPTAEKTLEDLLRDLFPLPHQAPISTKRTVEDNRRDVRERIENCYKQRLTTVKEKLEELETSESDTKSYSNAFMKGRKAERKRILTLIKTELQ